MSATSNLWLHDVNVVITADEYGPGILSKQFLQSSGIVPESWEINELVNSPHLSIVECHEDIRWTLDSSKLVIEKQCQSFVEENYYVHDLAREYLARLPKVSYRDLGLNWSGSVERQAPEAWLTERFLKPLDSIADLSSSLIMTPRFCVAADDVVYNLTFTAGLSTRSSENSVEAIMVDCNVHHPGRSSTPDLENALAQWPDCQRRVVQLICRLLGE